MDKLIFQSPHLHSGKMSLHQSPLRIDVTSSSEREMRDFAKKRGLTLSNWMVTQQRLVKPQPPMLSQIYLQSYRDL